MTNHTTMPTPGEIEAMREDSNGFFETFAIHEIYDRLIITTLSGSTMGFLDRLRRVLCNTDRLIAAYTEKSEECEREKKIYEDLYQKYYDKCVECERLQSDNDMMRIFIENRQHLPQVKTSGTSETPKGDE